MTTVYLRQVEERNINDITWCNAQNVSLKEKEIWYNYTYWTLKDAAIKSLLNRLLLDVLSYKDLRVSFKYTTRWLKNWNNYLKKKILWKFGDVPKDIAIILFLFYH